MGGGGGELKEREVWEIEFGERVWVGGWVGLKEREV